MAQTKSIEYPQTVVSPSQMTFMPGKQHNGTRGHIWRPFMNSTLKSLMEWYSKLTLKRTMIKLSGPSYNNPFEWKASHLNGIIGLRALSLW